jgi:hypothetical protein
VAATWSTWTVNLKLSGSLGSGVRDAAFESLGEVDWHGRRVMGNYMRAGAHAYFDAERRIVASVRDGKPIQTYHPYGGPGLRWGIMGNMISITSAAARAASSTSFSNLPVRLTTPWKTLGTPMLTPEIQKKLVDSVHAEVGSRTIKELEAERDEILLGLLELRAKRPETSLPTRSRPSSEPGDGFNSSQDCNDLFGAPPRFDESNRESLNCRYLRKQC